MFCCCNSNYKKSLNYKCLSERPELHNLTLHDVCVATSHNSYLSGFQHCSRASIESIINCLDKGARCIELDIFSGENNKPIIGHGTLTKNGTKILTSTTINLEDVLYSIINYDMKGDPLFICIENNTGGNIDTNNKMKELFMDICKDRLIVLSVDEILKGPLYKFLNKIIILTGGGSCGEFPEIVSVYWGMTDDVNNDSSDTDPKRKVWRIYPEGNLRGIFSKNYDAIPFIKNENTTFIAMNYQTMDNNMIEYLKKFDECSFIKKSA